MGIQIECVQQQRFGSDPELSCCVSHRGAFTADPEPAPSARWLSDGRGSVSPRGGSNRCRGCISQVSL